MNNKIKRTPTFKQMAFETAVRNPERYLPLLKSIKDFEGYILDNKNLLEIVSHLYLIGEVTSEKILITKGLSINEISSSVIDVNSSRNADGGFPRGYASRFWTYMRTISELGFIYAQYNEKLKFSEIAKKLINDEIDEQEAFSIQSMKYNRLSPYRNVSNDFNFFRFILELLLNLKEKNSSLSYEQFVVATFSKDGDVNDMISILDSNKFKDYNDAYNFVKVKYDVTTKLKTVTADYPDVIRRILIISGFISIKYSGKKFIQLNENKLNYIKELLKIKFSLSSNEKSNSKLYFEKFNTNDAQFLELVKKYRKDDDLVISDYSNKLIEVIDSYNINEEIITRSILNLGTRKHIIEEFKEIPEPLKLEFYISILIALKYGNDFTIKPNYKADHTGKPYSHAPGQQGDIEVFSDNIYWLIEVTMIRNKIQQINNETTSVIRHISSNDNFKDYLLKYLSFIAPVIHDDTKDYFNYSIVNNINISKKLKLKPYSFNEFIDVTLKEQNFDDMNKYTNDVIQNFRDKLQMN